MTLSELDRLARIVDGACQSLIERPYDGPARDSLFNVLAPLISSSVIDCGPQPAHIHGLLRQAAALAAILRQRIVDGSRPGERESLWAMQVLRRTRELRRILTDLLEALAKVSA